MKKLKPGRTVRLTKPERVMLLVEEANRAPVSERALSPGETGQADERHPHLIAGEFQSDKYPTTPRGKVPLSVKDKTAQDLLWAYAQRRRSVDAEFAADLEIALKSAGYTPTPTGAEIDDAWQPIETAPKGRKLIVGYFNDLGNWRSVMGCYYEKGTLDANHDYIDGDEDGCAPEGWYEEGETYSEGLLPTDKPPTYWQPLPSAPGQARHLPRPDIDEKMLRDLLKRREPELRAFPDAMMNNIVQAFREVYERHLALSPSAGEGK